MQPSRPVGAPSLRLDQHFAADLPGAELGKGRRGFCERTDRINHWSEFSGGRPFEGRLDVGAVAPVTADQALLFHEERP